MAAPVLAVRRYHFSIFSSLRTPQPTNLAGLMPRSHKITCSQRRPATRSRRRLNDTLSNIDDELATPVTPSLAAAAPLTMALPASPAAASPVGASSAEWSLPVSTSVDSSPSVPASSQASTSASTASSAVEAPGAVDDESDPDLAALLVDIFGPPAPIQRRPRATVVNINGYQYTRSAQSRIKTTFRCSFYRRLACRGRCKQLAGSDVYVHFVPHTCQMGPIDGDDTRDICVEMEERVDVLSVTRLQETANAIWRIVNTEFYLGQENAVLVGLTRDQVISRVYRARRLHFGGDIHGQIEVEPLAMVAGTTLNFFQFHYSYLEDGTLHRVIGWARPALLQLLRYRRTTLFIDGTFCCVPVPFKQCVVVMCLDNATNCYVPVFYSLATGRSHTMYWNILHFLIMATDHQLDPESVTCDYEAALIAAIRDQLPTTTINGCLFHWKQAIRRRIKKLRISEAEAGFAMERGAMDMLTVIPTGQVSTLGKAFVQDYIQRRCRETNVTYSEGKWASYWSYFDRTWLAMFPVELWNVHGINHAVINRTNNPLERFNRELNAAFPTPHPKQPLFISTIERISRQRVQFLADVLARRARTPRHQPYELTVAARLT